MKVKTKNAWERKLRLEIEEELLLNYTPPSVATRQARPSAAQPASSFSRLLDEKPNCQEENPAEDGQEPKQEKVSCRECPLPGQ